MSNQIDHLVNLISKLPGMGKRSARRSVLFLIKNKNGLMQQIVDGLVKAKDNILVCDNCGNIDDINPCNICQNLKRDQERICVVEEIADLWAIERGAAFSGLYHVLGGTLSAMDGRGPEELAIEKLVKKVANGNLVEVILATSATIEGQTTAHYVSQLLKDYNVTISRLAFGIPMGGELDYLDDGTLTAAIKSRKLV